jgi:hypothetical protein
VAFSFMKRRVQPLMARDHSCVFSHSCVLLPFIPTFFLIPAFYIPSFQTGPK